MSKFNVNHITSKSGKNGPVLAGITTVSSTGAMRIPSGPTEYRGGRGRAVFGGGYGASSPYPELNVLDMVNITTTGNASDFGDMTVARTQMGSNLPGNATRVAIAGGKNTSGTWLTTIDYVVVGTTGNASDFGNLATAVTFYSGTSGC